MTEQNDKERPESSVDSGRSREPVARALRLLEFMVEARADYFTVRELVALSGLPASSVHRLAKQLEAAGVVSQSDKGLQLDMGFYRLALQGADKFSLRRIAHPFVVRAARQTDETVVLATYERSRQEMMFVDYVESPHPLRYVLALNEWLPIHAGAAGLVILANLPEEEQKRVLSDHLVAVTERTITSPDELRRELRVIGQTGHAISFGQRTAGVVGIAAAVFGPGGLVMGSVCSSVPETRADEKQRSWIAQCVVAAAADVTRALQGARHA